MQRPVLFSCRLKKRMETFSFNMRTMELDLTQAGKQAAVGALIGQVMKAVKGADPQKVRELLVAKLQG